LAFSFGDQIALRICQTEIPSGYQQTSGRLRRVTRVERIVEISGEEAAKRAGLFLLVESQRLISDNVFFNRELGEINLAQRMRADSKMLSDQYSF